MSTSKIGRAIKPRDVVTPGHSKHKEESSFESVKKELCKVEQVCEILQEKYNIQSEKLAVLATKFSKLEQEHQEKSQELVLVKQELQNKKEQLNFISRHVSELENKLTKLTKECEELRSSISDRQKTNNDQKSGWKLF